MKNIGGREAYWHRWHWCTITICAGGIGAPIIYKLYFRIFPFGALMLLAQEASVRH
jgi:hypothetical protein